MIQGDARKLRDLPVAEGSVDCIITSPPYWDLKRYGDGSEDEIGHREGTYAEYLSAVGAVFEESLRLAKPDAVMWLVADTLRGRGADRGRQLPLPFDLAREAEAHGWRLQETIVWVKNKTLPYSGEGKLRNLIEYVLFFTRSRQFKHYPHRFAERHLPDAEWVAGWPERYHPLGRRPSNVWHIRIPTQGMWAHSERLHFCPFPQELVARCIGLTTNKGDLVFDPFAGVGTVPAQAVAMGRRALGVELNPTNIELFRERTLPAFQRDWEAKAAGRRLARDDQRNEAILLLQLRLLKAGKELLRLCERLAQANTSDHPAAAVESVVVHRSPELPGLVDVEAGAVGRPTAHVTLLAQLEPDDHATLLAEIRPALRRPPFAGLSLDVEIQISDPDEIEQRLVSGEELLEFGQSRHGAFTAELDDRLFPARPRLLTTLRLPAPVVVKGDSPLELARQHGERQLLERELRQGGGPDEIARRLGVHRSQLEELLVRHGLREEPRSFAVPLPEQIQVRLDP
ncbi:MAG TPA: DNA methyltransferase [Solirubrobacteraceae bacterium]|jgi:DNA modification methylase